MATVTANEDEITIRRTLGNLAFGSGYSAARLVDSPMSELLPPDWSSIKRAAACDELIRRYMPLIDPPNYAAALAAALDINHDYDLQLLNQRLVTFRRRWHQEHPDYRLEVNLEHYKQTYDSTRKWWEGARNRLAHHLRQEIDRRNQTHSWPDPSADSIERIEAAAWLSEEPSQPTPAPDHQPQPPTEHPDPVGHEPPTDRLWNLLTRATSAPMLRVSLTVIAFAFGLYAIATFLPAATWGPLEKVDEWLRSPPSVIGVVIPVIIISIFFREQYQFSRRAKAASKLVLSLLLVAFAGLHLARYVNETATARLVGSIVRSWNVSVNDDFRSEGERTCPSSVHAINTSPDSIQKPVSSNCEIRNGVLREHLETPYSGRLSYLLTPTTNGLGDFYAETQIRIPGSYPISACGLVVGWTKVQPSAARAESLQMVFGVRPVQSGESGRYVSEILQTQTFDNGLYSVYHTIAGARVPFVGQPSLPGPWNYGTSVKLAIYRHNATVMFFVDDRLVSAYEASFVPKTVDVVSLSTATDSDRGGTATCQSDYLRVFAP